MKIKASKDLIKTIIIIVLCIALVGETVALVMTKLPSDSENKNSAVISVDATGVVKTLKPDISGIINKVTDGLTQGNFDFNDIKGSLRKIIYSDTIVSTVMSLSYPLLYNTLDNLSLMDFAEYVSLYPTGPQAGSRIRATPPAPNRVKEKTSVLFLKR